MKYTETCPCGSLFEFEARGWGLRRLDCSEPLAEWRSLHRHCLTISNEPANGVVRRYPNWNKVSADLRELADRSRNT